MPIRLRRSKRKINSLGACIWHLDIERMIAMEDELNKRYEEAAAFDREQSKKADRQLAMRATEDDYEAYADRYQDRANNDPDMQGDADWELFDQLWSDRHNSKDDMAELLAEVMGIAHDEALAWVEGRDTP